MTRFKASGSEANLLGNQQWWYTRFKMVCEPDVGKKTFKVRSYVEQHDK